MTAVESIERPKSLTCIAMERMLDSIVYGPIELGSLLSEKQMARVLGISKTPVREAFAHLQALGLVEVLPQKGCVVFQPTVEQIRELCEVRLELEVMAFRLAMERQREAFTKRFADVVHKMTEVFDVERPLAYQRLDSEFHCCFFQHCGNSLLADAYSLFSPRICAVRTHLSTPQPYLLNRSFEEHKMMLELVKAGDVESGVLMLREHINRTRESHCRMLSALAMKSAKESE